MYSPSRKTCDPFILTEENINRIVDIYNARKPTSNESNDAESGTEVVDDAYDLRFIVTRLDNYKTLTDSLEDVLSEENRGKNRIVGLTIRNKGYYDKNELNFKVDFNSCENEKEFRIGFDYFDSIEIQVDGDKRDVVQLLFNDLDAYIQNSVVSEPNKKWISLIKRMQSTRTSLFGMILFWAVIMGVQLIPLARQVPDYSSYTHKNQVIQEAIQSADLEYKINKLLELSILEVPESRENIFSDTLSSPIMITIIIGFLLYIIISFLWMSEKIQKSFYSLLPYVFDFGTYPENYQYRIRIIKIIISSIGALFLGLVGNAIYSLISSVWM